MTAPPESLMDAERETTALRMGQDFDSALPGDHFRSVWEFGCIFGNRPTIGPMNAEALRLADQREHEGD